MIKLQCIVIIRRIPHRPRLCFGAYGLLHIDLKKLPLNHQSHTAQKGKAMKSTFSTKALSIILVLVMLASAFAAIPASAEDTAAAEGTATVKESSEGKVLYYADFDKDGLSTLTNTNLHNALEKAYKTNFVIGTGASTDLTGDPNIAPGTLINSSTKTFVRVSGKELAVNRRILSVVPNVSYTKNADDSYTVKWNDVTKEGAANNDFYNLFSGNYFDENGNRLTEYYLDLDYTHAVERNYYKEGENSKTYTYTADIDNDGADETVSYKVSTKGRGESIFTVMFTGGYSWISKVSQDGYLYVNNSAQSVNAKFNPLGAATNGPNNNPDHFTFVKSVTDNGTTTSSARTPMTAEIWADINAEFTAAGVTSAEELDITTCCNYRNAGVYQMIGGEKYNLRYTFSVADNGKVTVNVYVKPDAFEGGAWHHVGEVSYTPKAEYLQPAFGEDGTATSSLTSDSRAYFAVRFTEDVNYYAFDNLKFCTWAEKCEGNEHIFLVGDTAKLAEDGKTLLSLGTCQSCGKTYALSGELRDKDFVNLDFDSFTTKTELETELKKYAAKASADRYSQVTGGKTEAEALSAAAGYAFQYLNVADNASLIDYGHFSVSGVDSANQDFWIEFDSTFSDIQKKYNGETSMLTFMRHSLDYEFIAVRLIDTDSKVGSEGGDKAYMKLFNKTNGASWSNITELCVLSEGVHYMFKFHFRPREAEFDAYVYTYNTDGSLKLYAQGVGFIPTVYTTDDTYYDSTYGYGVYRGSTDKPVLHRLEGYPAIRVFASTTQNTITTFRMYDGTYGVLDKAELIYTPTSEKKIVPTFSNVKTASVKISDGELAVGSIGAESSMIMFENADKLFSTTPYYISFDFKIDSGLFSPDNPKAYDNGNQFWSLIGNVSGSSVFNTWLRVGGVDANDDGVLDKMFLFCEKKSFYEGNGFTTKTDTGYQSVGSDYYTDENSVYDLVPGEWVRLTAIADPVSKVLRVYADNNLIVSIPQSGVSVDDNIYIRLGDGFRKFIYDWSAKNFEAGFTTNADNLERSLNISETIWKPDLYSAPTSSLSDGLGKMIRVGASVWEKSVDNHLHMKGTVNKSNAFGESHINMNASYKDENGKNVHVLEGQRYVISSTFALPIVDYVGFDGVTVYNSKTSGDASIFRLSKYTDSNQVRLLYCKNGGFHTIIGEAGTKNQTSIYIYDAEGTRLNAWTTVTDGRPDKWTTVSALVDEGRNTFSLYINGQVAYYSTTDAQSVDTSKLTPAIDMPILVKESGAVTDKAYKEITSGFNPSGSGYTNKQYIRFFQNCCEVYVKEASVSLIKDEKVELIGTQSRNTDNAELDFDLRFIFGVDDLYVDDIEYKVSVSYDGNDYSDNAKTQSSEKTVYSSVKVENGASIKSVDHAEGNYLSCLQVCGIPKAEVEGTPITFTVTPYRVRHSSLAPVELETYVITATYADGEVTISYAN